MSKSAAKIKELTTQINGYRHEYYNLNSPTITDAEYDKLVEELDKLEKETGIILSNSPTQTVGFTPVSSLEKTQHEIPLLSLEKTKSIDDLLKFAGGQATLLMHKLDGLTVKLIYEDGTLQSASTRGNGEVGELVTHNIAAISDIPTKIPYSGRLVVTGEGYILDRDFQYLKGALTDSSGNPYSNSRNLAAGSIRLFDPATCIQRKVRFTPFNVLEGLTEEAVMVNSKFHKLLRLQQLGFTRCQAFMVDKPSYEVFEMVIQNLKNMAAESSIPIDGIVVTFNDIEYSRSLGKTGHHYKDGMAFKFKDDTYETVLRCVEWNPTRFGEIVPVAVFDTVVIDGCDVSRATLHNPSIIKEHQLNIGDRILISKRGSIIPHVEENLDRDGTVLTPPEACPSCGQPTTINSDNVLCENMNCPAKNIRKFVHFADKKAMDIAGLSQGIIEKLFDRGWLHTFADIYRLDEHKDKIVEMEGFGVKSYNKMMKAIEKSRNTTFERFLIAMDIPLVGSHVSKILKEEFNNDLYAFREAVIGGRNFTATEGIGETIDNNIHIWFSDVENLKLWDELYPLMRFKQDSAPDKSNTSDNIFNGCKVVVTGSVEGFTRTTIKTKLEELGAKVSGAVSSKTDLVIVGTDPGESKLADIRKHSVKTISSDEFLTMINP